MQTNVRLNANWGWGDRDFELVPGELTDDARYVFTRGQCHSLALALHEATGWPIFGDFVSEYDDTPDHVFVQAPDGRFVDVEGTPTILGAEVREVDPEDCYESFGGDYRRPEVEAARHWVEPVLAQVGLAVGA